MTLHIYLYGREVKHFPGGDFSNCPYHYNGSITWELRSSAFEKNPVLACTVNPSVGRWMENFDCRAWPYIYVYIHNPERTQKMLWTPCGRLGKPAIDTLESSMMKKMATDSKAKGKKWDLHMACLVNSCQGKNAGVLFRLNYLIHQHTGIGWDACS